MPGYFSNYDEYGPGYGEGASPSAATDFARYQGAGGDASGLGGFLSRLFSRRRQPTIDQEIGEWAKYNPNYGPQQPQTAEQFWQDYYSGGQQASPAVSAPPATSISSAPEMRDLITRAMSGLLTGSGSETGGTPVMYGGQGYGGPDPMMVPPVDIPAFESPTAGFPFMKGAYGMGPNGPVRTPAPARTGEGTAWGSWFRRAEGGPIEDYGMDMMPQGYLSRGYVPSDGQGDGRSDHIEALLSPGEFVQDAETTALLGDGDSEAGARKWEALRQHIRKKKGRSLAKGKFGADAPSVAELARIADAS